MIDKELQSIEEDVHYLNDISIHITSTKDKHLATIENILKRLMDHNLAVNLSMSEFHIKETVFLKYIINRK